MLKSPTFRDSGLLYLRSMLGGLGGPITESQLSKASRVELNNAIARAKQRTGSELEFAEKQLKEAKELRNLLKEMSDNKTCPHCGGKI